MLKFRMLPFCATAIAVFAAAAYADTDPAMFQDGSNCTGTFWCASTTIAVDPVTGDPTREFLMNTGTTNAVNFTSTGWVKAVTGSTVDDLLDFEVIAGQSVVFLYCGDTQCHAGDVGLPAGITTTVSFADGGTYTPTSGQPGFGNVYDGGVHLTSQATFGVEDVGPFVNGVGVIATPEPSSVLFLAGVLLMAGGALRKKVR